MFVEPNYGSGHGLIAMFAVQDPAWFFQCKILLVVATLLRGLSDFIWAVRQINYCLAAIGASPSRQEERDLVAWTHALTLVLNPALRSFSVGVRSYYFTVADRFSGAHVMMKRSHKSKPLTMLLGSARASPEAVYRQFGRDNEITIEGPAGTGFVQDTSCYHRASPPTRGDRLMLAVRFIN